jgi:putative endonuclease
MKKGGVVYIMTNRHRTVFYTGVTSDLVARVQQHVNQDNPRSFTARYNAVVLVYYEAHGTIMEAISREKQDKAYSRKKKIALIETMNPGWNDLFNDVMEW